MLISEIKSKISPIAKEYGIERVYLFGSYARNEQDEQSDIDLRIDKGRLRGLDFISFAMDTEEALGKHVDVVTTKSLDSDFLLKIQNDEVLLYESR